MMSVFSLEVANLVRHEYLVISHDEISIIREYSADGRDDNTRKCRVSDAL